MCVLFVWVFLWLFDRKWMEYALINWLILDELVESRNEIISKSRWKRRLIIIQFNFDTFGKKPYCLHAIGKVEHIFKKKKKTERENGKMKTV